MRFVLVHGAGSGAWVWQRVIAELERLGHEAVAMDLPGSGARRDEQATLEGYRAAVLEVLHEGDVLVGHSMSGYVISAVADAAPSRIGQLVYLAAGVPIEGKSMIEATPLDSLGMDRYVRWITTVHGPAFELASAELAADLLHHDWDEEWIQRGYELAAPQQVAPITVPLNLPNFWAADIPRSYVLCTEDRSGCLMHVEEFLDRLGLKTAYVVQGSHGAHWSRPEAVAKVLVQAAAEECPMTPFQTAVVQPGPH